MSTSPELMMAREDDRSEASGKEWHVLRRSSLQARHVLESVALTRFALASVSRVTKLFCPSVALEASRTVFNAADNWVAWALEKGVLTIYDFKKREESLLDTCSVLSANVARLRTNVAETAQDKGAVAAEVVQLKSDVARLQQMTHAAERSRETAEAARNRAELELVREQLVVLKTKERIRQLEEMLHANTATQASHATTNGQVGSYTIGSSSSSASDGSCLDDASELEAQPQRDGDHCHSDNEEDGKDEEQHTNKHASSRVNLGHNLNGGGHGQFEDVPALATPAADSIPQHL
jgi:hypothetical protein